MDVIIVDYSKVQGPLLVMVTVPCQVPGTLQTINIHLWA